MSRLEKYIVAQEVVAAAYNLQSDRHDETALDAALSAIFDRCVSKEHKQDKWPTVPMTVFHEAVAKEMPQLLGLDVVAAQLRVEVSTDEYALVSMRAFELGEDLLYYWFVQLSLYLIADKLIAKG